MSAGPGGRTPPHARTAAAGAAPGTPAPSSSRAPSPPPCPQRLVGRLGRLLQGDGVDVAWRPVPDPIPVGEPFAIEYEVCPRRPGERVEALRIDAWMPGSGHRADGRPIPAGEPPGPRVVPGLRFDRPGRWQVVFELRAGGRTLRLADDLTMG